jgi:uncharacterized membrane protein YfcA
MNIVAYAHKFFIFSGILLISIAVFQVLTRPRAEDGRRAMLRLDATTVRAILFVTVGMLTLLAGAGVIPMTPGR